VSSPIARILSWSRRHRARVLVGVCCVAAAASLGIRRLSFDTDVLSLLPREGEIVPAFRTFLSSFGTVDDLYVVLTAPPGRTIDEYGQETAAWVQRLRETPGIVRVDDGRIDSTRDLSWLADRRLLLLGDATRQEAIWRFGDGMRNSLQGARTRLTVPAPEVAEMVKRDPLLLFELVARDLGATQAGVNLVPTEDGYISADRKSHLLIARPARPPFDAEFSRTLMNRLGAQRASPPATAEDGSPHPPLQVQFAGGHRIAVETEAVIRRESIVNTIGSLALILPLLYLVFRSPWLVVVGALPSTMSLVIALGALGVAGATLSTAATASSAMLFGLGVDGVVLLYVSYTLAVRDGAPADAAVDGLSGAAWSMLLGMWTTAATFYGLTFVDFPSLEQLGALIGHSMILCGVLTLILVPALLPRRPARTAPSLSMHAFAGWVNRRPGAILISAAAATALLGAAATQLRINPTLDRLRAVTPGAELLQRIGPMFGLPDDVYVAITEGPDLEALLAANERLRASLADAIPGLRVQAPTALLPSESTQARRQQSIRESLPSPEAISASLTSAAASEGFRPGSFELFRERLDTMLDARLRLDYDGYVQHGLRDVIGRFVTRDGNRWRLATYAFPARAEEVSALENRVREADSGATLTGLALVNRELADRFLPQFLKGLWIGAAAVIVLVLVAFRNWRLSIFSLTPTAIGMVWAAGALALAGITLDLFALFAVVTFVGIGVDYGLHVVHRYRDRGNASAAVGELAPVILVAAAITLLGYGTLVMSSYPPLRSIGVVSAVSIVMLAVASLFVLPALLTLSEKERRP
jgi:uncharacterized protein